MSRAGPGPSSLRRSLPLTPALPSGLPPTEGPRPLRVRGEGALPTTSPPHIVSTAGSRGRARAVPLAAPHAAGGRNFPSNAAARVGRPRSGSLESPPNVPPRESGLAVVGPSAALAPSAPPPEVDAGCPWGTSPPPPPPMAAPLQSGCLSRLARWEETLPLTVGTWIGRRGGRRPGIAGHRSQPIHPQGHGRLLLGQWPSRSAQLCLSQWAGGWVREGPVPGPGAQGAGTGE